MPLTKGIKKLFARRKKPKAALQSNVISSIRSSRSGPGAAGQNNNVSQGTEATSWSSNLHPEISETGLGDSLPSRDSIPREESIAEEVAVVEGEEEEPSSEANGAMASSSERHVQYGPSRRDSGNTGSSLDEVSPLPSDRRQSRASTTTAGSDFNRDPPDVAASYNAIPLLEQTVLPRGGISMDTQAVGRVQVCYYTC